MNSFRLEKRGVKSALHNLEPEKEFTVHLVISDRGDFFYLSYMELTLGNDSAQKRAATSLSLASQFER